MMNEDEKAVTVPAISKMAENIFDYINGTTGTGTGGTATTAIPPKLAAILEVTKFKDFLAPVSSSKGTGSCLLQTILPILLYVVLFGGML